MEDNGMNECMQWMPKFDADKDDIVAIRITKLLTQGRLTTVKNHFYFNGQ